MSDKKRLLGLGKVSKDVLERTVVKHLPMDESPGLDGGVIRLSGEALLSHSPSIGVPLESLGFFAFHYAVSNVAERFGKPEHLISGIYLPTNSTEEELNIITKSLGEEARKYDVTVGEGPYSETIKMANFAVIMDMVDRGVPVSPDVLVSESAIPEASKKKIMSALAGQAQAASPSGSQKKREES